jgi:hypothetical protein
MTQQGLAVLGLATAAGFLRVASERFLSPVLSQGGGLPAFYNLSHGLTWR